MTSEYSDFIFGMSSELDALREIAWQLKTLNDNLESKLLEYKE